MLQNANSSEFNLLQPASQKQWLKINYYSQGDKNEYTSEIVNKNFFVAKNGYHDPHEEFNTFYSKLFQYLEDGKNIKTLCKFPARLTFFEENYNWFNSGNRPLCQEYINQNNPESIKSISIIFASGYFDSPSSYFGHTLMKYNYGDDALNQNTLDSSLNYGANNTDSENSPLYIIKGLFGGYNANYTRNNYFLHSHLYTNSQIRDLWEYKLQLTNKQKKFVIEHSWEMMNAKFSYYFFNDNCAHRIARLIEMATDKDLSSTHGFWLSPLQVIRKLADVKGNLIKSEEYYPSLKTIFSSKLQTINSTEYKKFISFFNKNTIEQKKELKNFDSKMLFLLLDYLDLKVAKLTLKKQNNNKKQELQNQRSLILLYLLQFPSNTIKVDDNKQEFTSLQESSPPSVLRVGYGKKPKGDFLKLNYRVANNDLLNTPIQGQEVSNFIVSEIEAEVYEDNIDITKAVLLDIINLNTNPLPIYMTKEYSWGIKFDYSPKNNICSDCSTLGAEAKIGRSYRINDTVIYGLAGGRLHTRTEGTDDYFTIISNIGSVTKITDKSTLGLFINGNYNTISDNTDYSLKSEISYRPFNNYDTRVSVEGDGKDTAIFFSVGYHFD